jgi:chemotaxis protein histidine kinase CheA
MSSLTDLPELVGFFSYSRRDDQHSQGALSRLRAQIHNELRLQLGFDFRLWQDTAAIPDGALWEDEIKRAISEAVFFIPIVTPSSVGSKHCRLEFEAFLEREKALDRNNLIFPVLYVGVPGLEKEELWRDDPLLSIIGTRQYIDWQKFRHRSFAEAEIAEKVEQYCANIVRTLRQPWISPAERRAAQEAEARRAADLERRQAEEETERQRLQAIKQQQAETERREREAAEAERREREAAEAALQHAQQQVLRRQTEASSREKAEAERQAAEKVASFKLASPTPAERVEKIDHSPNLKQATSQNDKGLPPAVAISASCAAVLLAVAITYFYAVPGTVETSRPGAARESVATPTVQDSAINVPGCSMFRRTDRVRSKSVMIFSTDAPRNKNAMQLATDAAAAAKQQGLRVDLTLFNDGISTDALRNTDIVIVCGPSKPDIDSEIRSKFAPAR